MAKGDNVERVHHLNVKVAERELEELRVVGQALNSEVVDSLPC